MFKGDGGQTLTRIAHPSQSLLIQQTSPGALDILKSNVAVGVVASL